MSDSIPKSDFVPKAGAVKIGGLGPKAQKLQALREKAERQKTGVKTGVASGPATQMKGKDSFANTKKTNFQRKAT